MDSLKSKHCACSPPSLLLTRLLCVFLCYCSGLECRSLITASQPYIRCPLTILQKWIWVLPVFFLCQLAQCWALPVEATGEMLEEEGLPWRLLWHLFLKQPPQGPASPLQACPACVASPASSEASPRQLFKPQTPAELRASPAPSICQ